MTPPEKPADLTPNGSAAGVEDAEGAPLTLEDALVAVDILRRTVETLQVENARLRGLVSPGYARHVPDPADQTPIRRQSDVP